MASSSLDLRLSVDQFHCSICLEVFTDPVTIPCGHTFCKTCITLCWDTRSHCQCPMCKNDFEKRPDLKINTLFSEMASQVKKQVLIVEQRPVAESGDVPCDVCIENKQKASKSCLVCLVSYCETHLEPHQVLTSFKRHKLVDPVENLENRICKKHERLLELFCKNDKTCLCQFCLLENDHKSHTVVSIDEECEERKVQLGKTEEQLQQMILERQQKVQEIRTSVKGSERNTQKEIADIIQIYTSVIRSIEKHQVGFIEEAKKRQKTLMKQTENTIKHLDHEINMLQTRRSEVRMLSDTKDQLHLLKASPSLCILPATKNCPGIRRLGHTEGKTLHEVESYVVKPLTEQLKNFTLCSIMKQYYVDVTLDLDTAKPPFFLSDDGKQVTYENTKQNLYSKSQRFDVKYCILAKEGFNSGRFYFEVDVSESSTWTVGLVKASATRKSQISWCPQNGIWSVGRQPSYGYYGGYRCEYKVYSDIHQSLYQQDKLQAVGVFVDYESREVSFYNAETGSNIYSFTQCTFREKVFPFLYNEGYGPIVIRSVSQT